jgi:hypothetical protein
VILKDQASGECFCDTCTLSDLLDFSLVSQISIVNLKARTGKTVVKHDTVVRALGES